MPGTSLTGKKIAMVIAFQDFRDEEYFIPKSIFEGEGARVITVSTQQGKALGTYGGTTNVDITLDELQAGDIDALVFIGGSGSAAFMDEPLAHRLLQDVVVQNKIVGAICIAPAILAKSGVLKGKKATVWSSQMDKSAVRILEKEGAEYQKLPVVIDGRIITADGPSSARKFAEAVVKGLTP